MEHFRNRRDAGARLGRTLSAYAGRTDLVVLGCPRGGVSVAYEVAKALDAPLDVLVVRKLGIPEYEEVAMGAIASGGIQVVDRHITQQLGITNEQLRKTIEHEHAVMLAREEAYRGGNGGIDVAKKIAIVVDDGLAIGSTILAAVTALRVRGPSKIIVAVPVAATAIEGAMRAHVDGWQCLIAPDEMDSVSDFYDDFAQPTDDDICGLLARRNEVIHGVSSPSDHRYRHTTARHAG